MKMSCDEALGGVVKKKPAMGHSQPGSTSHEDETLGGKAKKRVAPAHVGARSTSHEEETLGGMAKKRIPAGGGTGGNKALGDAAGVA